MGMKHPARFDIPTGALQAKRNWEGGSSSSAMPETEDLFAHDVPLLRTSLARHGLVDLLSSPRARSSPQGPPSSEDLTAADRGQEQWDTHSAVVSGGAGLEALVSVDNVVVGHIRAARELRRNILHPPSPKDSSTARESVTRKALQEDRLRRRPGSFATFSSPPPTAAPARRQRADSAASLAAASAMAAVRKGDRSFNPGAAGRAPWRPAAASQETQRPATVVSVANLLDIAVNIFGNDGGGARNNIGIRRRSGGSFGTKSGGWNQNRNKGGKLSTFTVDVHTGGSASLGVTVKELGGGTVLVEDVRKMRDGCSGPAELAGILVGDVILGINYKPLEKGLVHTSALVAEAITLAGFVKLQICRASNTWRHPLPGKDCSIVTELMWRTAQLRNAGIISSAERRTIVERILQHMAWEEGALVGPPRAQAPLSAPVVLQLEHTVSALLDSLISQVKGLREAVSVRCLHLKSTIGTKDVLSVWGPQVVENEALGATMMAPPEATISTSALVTLRYVLRVEDVGTGREWLVFPRYKDFSELHQELLLMWPPIADLPFPAKRPVQRATAIGSPAEAARAGVGEATIEEGVAGLEAFLEGAMALLGTYLSIDPRCSGALRLVQNFLGRPNDLAGVEMALSPLLCDQKRAEVQLYKMLNQADSPASRMKHLLMRHFESEVLLAPDVESLMNGASSRLRRLQDFVLEQHEEQLLASSYATSEERRPVTRKAVRRQVELSFYLPLRRCIWKELTRRLQGPARELSRAITVLRRSSPAVFGLENLGVLASKEWGPSQESMQQATRRVLPTDQIDGLRRAAQHIAALHASLQQNDGGDSGHQAIDERRACSRNLAEGAVEFMHGDAGTASLELHNSMGKQKWDVAQVQDATAETDGPLSPVGWNRNGSRLAVGESEARSVKNGTQATREEIGGRANSRGVGSITQDTTPVQPFGRATTEFHATNDVRSEFRGSYSWHVSDSSEEESRSPEQSTFSKEESAGTLPCDAAAGSNGRVRDGEAAAIDAGEGAHGGTNSRGAMGADDFLPLFALVLVHSAPLDLLVSQTLLTHLMDLDGSLSEAGYLVATLEAAVSFIMQVYSSTFRADETREPPP